MPAKLLKQLALMHCRMSPHTFVCRDEAECLGCPWKPAECGPTVFILGQAGIALNTEHGFAIHEVILRFHGLIPAAIGVDVEYVIRLGEQVSRALNRAVMQMAERRRSLIEGLQLRAMTEDHWRHRLGIALGDNYNRLQKSRG